MNESLIMSTLPKTWIFDLDGTLVQHNGYLMKEGDRLLPGVKDYLDSLPQDDFILLLTARTEKYQKETLTFLQKTGLRYDKILFGMPQGERILINDRKPSGINMAWSVNLDRNCFTVPLVVCEL